MEPKRNRAILCGLLMEPKKKSTLKSKYYTLAAVWVPCAIVRHCDSTKGQLYTFMALCIVPGLAV